MTQITVPNVPTFVEYSVPTLSSGPFTVPFPFFGQDDVKARTTDALGVEVEFVVTTDFTFTTLTVPVGQEGTGYQGGAITMNSPIGEAGMTLRIYRHTVIDRTANFPSTGPFSIPVLNDEQNNETMILQEVQESIDSLGDDSAQVAINVTNIAANTAGLLKTVRVGDDPLTELPGAASRADKFLKFTPSGDVEAAVFADSTIVLSRSIIGGHLYPQTTVESVAGITPTDYAYPHGHVLRYGAVADGTTDNTTAFNNAVTGADHGVVYFPAAALSYRTDRITMAAADSNLYFFLEPGVELECTAAGTGIFRGNDASDITISGFGATCTMADQAGGSSNVNFSGGSRILIEGLRIIGAGASKDGIYIGIGGGSLPCYNVTIRKCYIANAQRNQISIVGGFKTIIEDCDIAGGYTVNPGAAIDLEANIYNTVQQTIIRNNWIHGVNQYGILNAFGEDGVIEGNLIEGCEINAIAISGGGSWEENGANHDVRRPISDYDLATGQITIHTPDNPPTPWDEPVHAGQICQFITLNGKLKPTEFQSATWFVVQSVVGNLITIGIADSYGEYTTLSDKGTAILSSDPAITEQFFLTYNPGVASGYIVKNNTIKNTATAGGRYCIQIGPIAVNTIVADNIINCGLDTNGLQVRNSEGCNVYGNMIIADPASVTPGFGRGLGSSLVSRTRFNDNFVSGFPGSCDFSGLANQTMNIGYIQNCGFIDGESIDMNSCVDLTINGLSVINGPDYALTNGIIFQSASTFNITIVNSTVNAGTTDLVAINGAAVYKSNCTINSKKTGPIMSYNNIPTALNTYSTFSIGAVTVDQSPTAGTPVMWMWDGANWVRFASLKNANAYTPTNVVTDRSYDADATTIAELADVLGTLIADLKQAEILS